MHARLKMLKAYRKRRQRSLENETRMAETACVLLILLRNPGTLLYTSETKIVRVVLTRDGRLIKIPEGLP